MILFTIPMSTHSLLDFLDHLMRETPSKHMIAIKRSFFHRKMVERLSIGGGVEAMKGVYQSIRAAQVVTSYLSQSKIS